MIVGQFLGQFLVFLIFPIFVLPYVEERFEVRLQHVLPPMDGKVLFYRYTPAIESLLEEFSRVRSPFLVFEEDVTLARNLRDRAYNVVIGTYKNPVMGLGEAGLVAAIVFHAFNGLRIVLVDFWDKGAKYQRVMLWVVLGLFVVTMAGFLPRHLMHVFGGE